MTEPRAVMSHSAVVFSPPGTSVLDRTVGELVAERPSRSRVFQRHGIDFCCQGGRTLAEACERKIVDPSVVVGELEAESREAVDELNPAELPPVELIDHIVSKHHGYLREELPRLHIMAERVAQVHGSRTPSLIEVLKVFEALSFELAHHLMKEEEVLFPEIRSRAKGESAGIPLDGAIGTMLEEHDEAGAALAKLRELTNGFTPPAEACNTYRALFAGLADLETDLHRHIHLENSVLFRAAREMAEA